MAFDNDDLLAVEDAIETLLAGGQVTRVTVGGRTTEYSDGISLKDLLALRKEILGEIGTTNSTRKPYFVARTSKGL